MTHRKTLSTFAVLSPLVLALTGLQAGFVVAQEESTFVIKKSGIKYSPYAEKTYPQNVGRCGDETSGTRLDLIDLVHAKILDRSKNRQGGCR